MKTLFTLALATAFLAAFAGGALADAAAGISHWVVDPVPEGFRP